MLSFLRSNALRLRACYDPSTAALLDVPPSDPETGVNVLTGFHIVTATHKPTGAKHILSFTGIFKFTGLNPGDEDEESSCTDDASRFFTGGARMSDATGFWCTVKSNGENAKFRVVELDGVVYILAGSKVPLLRWLLSRCEEC